MSGRSDKIIVHLGLHLTVTDFTLLFRAALSSSLGSWVEVANYVARQTIKFANFESKFQTSAALNLCAFVNVCNLPAKR